MGQELAIFQKPGSPIRLAPSDHEQPPGFTVNGSTFTSAQFRRLAFILVLAALWLGMGQYQGFFQDARLYSMLALHRLNPANFHNDLFVSSGGQDGFTVFPAIYAALTQCWGLDTAAFVLTATAQILWFVALLRLLGRITTGWPSMIALACIVYCSRFYEPYYMFSYAESFPTPRIYAETASLFALSALIDGAYARAACCVLIGALSHPLMCTYAALLVGLGFLTDRRFAPRWRLGLPAILVVGSVSALALKIPPFINLLHRYDADWWNVFAVSTPSATFPSDWSSGAMLRVVYLALVLGVAWWKDVPVLGRRVPLILGGVLLYMAIWIPATYYGHNLLITQLQLWRCIWLLQLLSLIAQGILIHRLWPAGGADRWLAAIMLTALLQVGFNSQDGTLACTLLISGIVLHLLLKRIPAATLGRSPWNMLPALLPLPQLLVNTLKASDLRLPQILAATSADWLHIACWGAAGVAFSLVICLAAAKRLPNIRLPDATLLIASVACLAMAAGIWSQPFLSANNKLSAEQDHMITELRARIPEGSVIYSNKSVLWSWFVLQRAYYVDHFQMTGGIFSRTAAVDGFRRMIFLCQVGVAGCPAKNFKDESASNPNAFWSSRTRLLCQEPILDFLVLQGATLSGPENEVLKAEDGKDVLTLVDCHKLREPPTQ